MKSVLYQKISGCLLADEVFCNTIYGASCRDVLEEQTEGMSRDELFEYFVDFLEGIRSVKQNVVNIKLFGKANPRV